jgi:putative AlgH/UPF0301 family transcriptional regulator
MNKFIIAGLVSLGLVACGSPTAEDAGAVALTEEQLVESDVEVVDETSVVESADVVETVESETVVE